MQMPSGNDAVIIVHLINRSSHDGNYLRNQMMLAVGALARSRYR